MPQVEGLMIRQAGETLYEFFPGTNTAYPPGPEVEVRLAGPSTSLAGIVQEVPPAVTTPPTITAAGTVMDGPPGAATGSPPPSAGYQWFSRGAEMPGIISKSYDHGGEPGVYTRRTIWTNGVGTPATSMSNAITVELANQPPTSSPISAQSLTVGAPYSFDPRPFFSDPDGDPLTFQYAGPLPTGITWNGQVFAGTPTVADQALSGNLTATDDVSGGAESRQISWATKSVADTTPPVLSSTAYNDTTDTVSFTVNEPSTIYWARHNSAAGGRTLLSNKTWSGSVVESGQFPANANGTVTIPVSDTPADRVSYAAVDAAGNVSATVTETNTTPSAAVSIVNLSNGLLTHTKEVEDVSAHPMGSVTIPSSGDGMIVVRGALCRTSNLPNVLSVSIGGVDLTLHTETSDNFIIVFEAYIPRASLPSGAQPVVVTPAATNSSILCCVKVDHLLKAGVPGAPIQTSFANVIPTTVTLDTNTAVGGAVLAVLAERVASAGTSGDITWTGVSENNRFTAAVGSGKVAVEFSAALTTTAETPRQVRVGGITGGRGGAISNFFGVV